MSRVGLIGSNSVEFIDKLLSIWNNNDSAVLIDYDTPAKAAADMLSEVGADFCYYLDNKMIDKVSSIDLAFFDSSDLNDKLNNSWSLIYSTKLMVTFVFDMFQKAIRLIISLSLMAKHHFNLIIHITDGSGDFGLFSYQLLVATVKVKIDNPLDSRDKSVHLFLRYTSIAVFAPFALHKN